MTYYIVVLFWVGFRLAQIMHVKSKMALERRKNPRFNVQSNAFVLFKAEPAKLIPIVNISLGGLGIGVNGINIDSNGFSDASCLEILTDDCRFYMDQLPYHFILPRRNRIQDLAGPFQHIYGVQFFDLMSSQRNRLKHFIRNHTRGGKTPKLISKVNQHLHQFIGKKDFPDACRNIELQVTSF